MSRMLDALKRLEAADLLTVPTTAASEGVAEDFAHQAHETALEAESPPVAPLTPSGIARDDDPFEPNFAPLFAWEDADDDRLLSYPVDDAFENAQANAANVAASAESTGTLAAGETAAPAEEALVNSAPTAPACDESLMDEPWASPLASAELWTARALLDEAPLGEFDAAAAVAEYEDEFATDEQPEDADEAGELNNEEIESSVDIVPTTPQSPFGEVDADVDSSEQSCAADDADDLAIDVVEPSPEIAKRDESAVETSSQSLEATADESSTRQSFAPAAEVADAQNGVASYDGRATTWSAESTDQANHEEATAGVNVFEWEDLFPSVALDDGNDVDSDDAPGASVEDAKVAVDFAASADVPPNHDETAETCAGSTLQGDELADELEAIEGQIDSTNETEEDVASVSTDESGAQATVQAPDSPSGQIQEAATPPDTSTDAESTAPGQVSADDGAIDSETDNQEPALEIDFNQPLALSTSQERVAADDPQCSTDACEESVAPPSELTDQPVAVHDPELCAADELTAANRTTGDGDAQSPEHADEEVSSSLAGDDEDPSDDAASIQPESLAEVSDESEAEAGEKQGLAAETPQHVTEHSTAENAPGEVVAPASNATEREVNTDAPADDAPAMSAAEQAALADLADETLAQQYADLGQRIIDDLGKTTRPAAVFTSAEHQPHVTEATLRTAIALAKSGRQVLIVDAALEDKHLTSGLGLTAEFGLTEALKGRVEWQHAVRATATHRLCVLPAGRLAPPQLFQGDKRLAGLFKELSSQWEVVLVDAGSYGDSAAPFVLEAVHNVYLLVRLGETQGDAAAEAIAAINATGANLRGCVATNA